MAFWYNCSRLVKHDCSSIENDGAEPSQWPKEKDYLGKSEDKTPFAYFRQIEITESGARCKPTEKSALPHPAGGYRQSALQVESVTKAGGLFRAAARLAGSSIL